MDILQKEDFKILSKLNKKRAAIALISFTSFLCCSSYNVTTVMGDSSVSSPTIVMPDTGEITDIKVLIGVNNSVMSSGDSIQLPGQNFQISSIKLSFMLTQKGTLKPNTVLRIPVSLTNNSNPLPKTLLSSGGILNILDDNMNVGTIQYVSEDRFGNSGYYKIVLSSEFELEDGESASVSVNFSPSSSSFITAFNSTEPIILTIDRSAFSFVPKRRIYEKDSGWYNTNDFAYSPSASQINIGTAIKDPDYLNNALSLSADTNSDTGIPDGDVINIERVTVKGSPVIGISIDDYLGNHTLKLSEDGTYLIKNDNSGDVNFPIGTGVTNLITLPSGLSDEAILEALHQSGKNSGAIIDEGNGHYIIAYNFGRLIGPGAYTYHDLFPNDDGATISNNLQEVKRSESVTEDLNKKLSSLYAFHSSELQTSINFSDSSISNSISGVGTQYDVNDTSIIKINVSNYNSNTTPSSARSEDQSKITVHYVDEDGKELALQSYSYGYPMEYGGIEASLNYLADKKAIPGYTLVTTSSPISEISGIQLTNSESIPFLENDQVYYYVYKKDEPIITTESSTVNETIHYQFLDGSQAANTYTRGITFIRSVSIDAVTGEKNYGSWSPDQSFIPVVSPILKGYTADKTEINSETVSGYSNDLAYTVVYTKDDPIMTTESKTVKETIQYKYSDGSQASMTYTKVLTFTRSVSIDETSGEKTYGQWSEDQAFDYVESPKLEGYTADKTSIASQVVSGDSSDLNYIVTYTRNSVPSLNNDKLGTPEADPRYVSADLPETGINTASENSRIIVIVSAPAALLVMLFVYMHTKKKNESDK